MPIDVNKDPTEATLGPDYSAVQQSGAVVQGQAMAEDATMEGEGDDSLYLSDREVLVYIGTAKRRSRNYQQIAALQEWEESEAAFRSQHHNRSKYNKPHYKNRSKYFKPKSRAAVYKNLLATSAAMFSSSDVIATEASDDLNKLQVANAALVKELINQRLNNKTRRAGVPWRQIVLGARQQTQVMGLCASKAYWSYRTKTRIETKMVQQPAVSRDGTPVIDFRTGQPFMETVQVDEQIVDVIEDKPVVELYALEMMLLNPAANWINPVQSSPDLIVQHPMFADDVRAMMQANSKSDTPWRDDITDEMFAQAGFTENELIGLRQVREGNGARESQVGKQTAGMNLPGQSKQAGSVLDVWENFFRIEGVDYHCWSLKDQQLLSDPVPVEEIYPAFRGERPYHIGTDMIEPFVLYPESDVHSWQQQQAELNDLSNLRMDAMRKSIYPTAMVRAGQNIDLKAVQRQDSQNLVIVRDKDDVTWDRPPGPHPSAYQEMNYLNTDFDDLAGQFSSSSVQTNRSLNETVGGMSLISQNANAISELKLSMFIDTWVEPVLGQLVALEQYYEDDATLLAICGKKAKLWQKFGVDEVTSELLESQITVSINAGGGSSDPVAKLMRFKTAFGIAMPILAKGVQDGQIDINYEEVANEVFSLASYKSGADRFITIKDQQDQQQVPMEKVKGVLGAAQKHIAELEAEIEKLKSGEATKVLLKKMDLEDKAEDRDLEYSIAQAEHFNSVQEQVFDAEHAGQTQANDHIQQVRMAAMQPKPQPGPQAPSAPQQQPMRPQMPMVAPMPTPMPQRPF